MPGLCAWFVHANATSWHIRATCPDSMLGAQQHTRHVCVYIRHDIDITRHVIWHPRHEFDADRHDM